MFGSIHTAHDHGLQMWPISMGHIHGPWIYSRPMNMGSVFQAPVIKGVQGIFWPPVNLGCVHGPWTYVVCTEHWWVWPMNTGCTHVLLAPSDLPPAEGSEFWLILPCIASTARDRKRSSITLNKNSTWAFQRTINQGSTPPLTSSKWG